MLSRNRHGYKCKLLRQAKYTIHYFDQVQMWKFCFVRNIHVDIIDQKVYSNKSFNHNFITLQHGEILLSTCFQIYMYM